MKQWEGVESNGLPTPVFNFLKRVTLFQVASITTENLKLHASAMGNSDKALARKSSWVINSEFDVLFEKNNIVSKLREYARNSAVDGDGCLYTYWDSDIPVGYGKKGAIVTEVLDNDKVFFGDPNERNVQKQPWVIIESRQFVKALRKRAEANGVKNFEDITEDSRSAGDSKFDVDGKATSLLYLKKEDGKIWAYECTKNCTVKPKWDTGLALYPICWLPWDYVKDNYHGQAMITGLIPNQTFVNKAYAMAMVSLMASAFPKTVYDKTRITHWDNRVAGAIPTAGNVNDVAKILEPAQISPQVSQFIDKAVDHTQTFLGATNAALGDTRPDNTSAIIALQRAAAVPSELTKQNLYKSVDELGLIYLDFMAVYYGKREVEIPTPKDIPHEIIESSGMGETMRIEFDFSALKDMPMTLRLDVGASSYWSEIASMQTLDNLLTQGKIDIVDYLERVPGGYISDQENLLGKYRRMMTAPEAAPQTETDNTMQLPMTAGNSQLQRKIVEQEM